MAKKRTFIVRSDDNLREFFLNNYQYSSWLHKFNILTYAIDNIEKLKIEFKELTSEGTKPTNLGLVKRSLKYELYFTSFHITEALFSLVYAYLNYPKNPWLILTVYTSEELNDFIGKIRYKKVVLSKNEIAFIFFLITDLDKFLLERKDIIPEEIEKIKMSINFIGEYLPRLAREYLENKDGYNSYKHGLRVMSGKSFVNVTEEKSGKSILSLRGDAIVFLERQRCEGKDCFKVRTTTKSFSYERASKIFHINYRLIQNIVYIRKQVMNSKKDDKEKIALNLFLKEKANDIFKINPTEDFMVSLDS